MKPFFRSITVALMVFLMIVLSGCGGSTSTTSTSPTTQAPAAPTPTAPTILSRSA